MKIKTDISVDVAKKFAAGQRPARPPRPKAAPRVVGPSDYGSRCPDPACPFIPCRLAPDK
jgi:hypothetical protein